MTEAPITMERAYRVLNVAPDLSALAINQEAVASRLAAGGNEGALRVNRDEPSN